ncbi:hypothetical protein [Glycomyces albidus]|jgi:hypothetical protein|uniref:hypothetical protein n=1 Tax=Glycomyces albidus TaxID=2656774 RepID=UPI00128FDD91|nr:hypothetical protein [Glycomyces albidus]
MADRTAATDPPPHLIAAEAEGYCDPDTGICVLPASTGADETDPDAQAAPATTER